MQKNDSPVLKVLGYRACRKWMTWRGSAPGKTAGCCRGRPSRGSGKMPGNGMVHQQSCNSPSDDNWTHSALERLDLTFNSRRYCFTTKFYINGSFIKYLFILCLIPNCYPSHSGSLINMWGKLRKLKYFKIHKVRQKFSYFERAQRS